MNRRGFLGVLVAVVAAPFVPYKPIGLGLSGTGVIGGITRETFTFWRNQHLAPVKWDDLNKTLRVSGGASLEVPLSFEPMDHA